MEAYFVANQLIIQAKIDRFLGKLLLWKHRSRQERWLSPPPTSHDDPPGLSFALVVALTVNELIFRRNLTASSNTPMLLHLIIAPCDLDVVAECGKSEDLNEA